MTDSVWLLLAAVAMLLATGWLALSLQPHWRQVFGTDAPPSALRLRAAGWSALLAAALYALVRFEGAEALRVVLYLALRVVREG